MHARIGQYELIRQIGRGGMGTVYLARDTRLARHVAIKFLAHASSDVSDRFLVEARATARCSHENIVVIHEVDEIEGQPYMVLEYLEGRSLRQLIDGGPVPAGRAIELMLPVTRALRHAHGFGIVHRDLKPENIFVSDVGSVKVLDFGIAKLLADDDVAVPAAGFDDDAEPGLATEQSALVGTLPYMSPEQWGADDVDHRTDIWAAGLVLFELVAGRHPLAPITRERLLEAATRLDQPMPAVAELLPDLPEALADVIDRCLAKRKTDRFADADELLTALESLLPRRRGLAEGESCPYPGLVAFREQDADLFYGRDAEVARLASRLRDRPLVAVVGPSGAGKSSFVFAGLIPELKRHQRWDVAVMRPGKAPLTSLASAVWSMTSGTRSRADDPGEAELAEQLWREPGALGAKLRRRPGRVLLFVDQFEELYTLGVDDDTRRAFLTALAGAGDDPASSVRVVVSMRSDFLDRAAADPGFLEQLTPGLTFLATPSRDALRAALVEPAASAGYRFEREAVIDEMVEQLATTRGGLPLLQFAAGRLWDQRDRGRKLLTETAYREIGGVTGAIASHADAVIAGLDTASQKLARALFERLVTPDRTRDVVARDELVALSDDRRAAAALIDHLIDARLLVSRSDSEDAGVEIVHENLIDGWPTLRGWLDRNQEDAAMLGRLRTAAKQWDDDGRSEGLLWRGDAVGLLQGWVARYSGRLPPRERAFASAVQEVANRTTRRRRLAIAGSFAMLVGLVIAAAIALLWIRDAERTARAERDRAVDETERAVRASEELERANRKLAAEQRRQAELLDHLQQEQAARQLARDEANVANRQVERGKVDLEKANRDLREALRLANAESERARTAAAEAERARAQEEVARTRAEDLARQERERADRLEQRRGKISTSLK